MDNNSPDSYYQKNKGYKKRSMKGIKIFPKKKKKESINVIAKDLEIFKNMKTNFG